MYNDMYIANSIDSNIKLITEIWSKNGWYLYYAMFHPYLSTDYINMTFNEYIDADKSCIAIYYGSQIKGVFKGVLQHPATNAYCGEDIPKYVYEKALYFYKIRKLF